MVRFSRRLPNDFEPNRIHLAIEARRRPGAVLIDLTETNPTRVALPAPAGDAWRGLVEGALETYAPTAAGAVPARAAISGYYADRGLDVPPDRLVLVASTSEAYAHLFRLLADPGDEFLAPEPSYPLFGPLAALENAELVPYPLRDHGGRWRVDLEALKERVGPRTRAIIVVHPNNPTGSLIDEAEAEALESLCAERDLALIADEVFGDFAFSGAPRRASFVTAERGLAFVLAGLSKTCGLPQAKLAWIACAGGAAEIAKARSGLEWMTDAFLSVSSPIQRAAPALLAARRPFIEATRARLQTNVAALDAARIEYLGWEGGWSAVVRAPASRNDEDWTLALLERDVIIQPGHFYDFEEESHLVVSLLPEPATFAEGARRLRAALGA